MNKSLIHIIIVIVFCSFIISCAKKPRPIKITKINILNPGIYTTIEKGSNVYGGKNNDQNISKLEVTEVTNWKLVTKSDIIPRTQRVSFGVTYIVAGYPEGSKDIPIKIKMVYPKGIEESIVKQHVIGKEHFVGLAFGPQFNYLPGRYGYQFFFKDQKLAEKFFTVYK
jgi:hypothetical protein